MTSDVTYCPVCQGIVNLDNPTIYHQHNFPLHALATIGNVFVRVIYI